MNKSEIFDFLNAKPIFHLATVEGNKPHVRGMMMYKADENGIVFHTGKMKDLHKQLTKNPNVEMSFNNGSFENLIQVRVSGTVELVEDIELKKEIVERREFLKPFIEQSGYEPLAVYRMKNGVATIWTMKTNFSPKEFVALY
ncbi:MAG: pyridoxamine 5'-phosphate oxidase [Nitrospirae bacterium CG1_02_44_142]|nr:MAG: pyridoxamine 5'-phosphate oxidase [Nitrospirae bacterium CG1_02_44_142]